MEEPCLHERCQNCGLMKRAHSLSGTCPKNHTISLDAVSIERYLRSGHPRSLGTVLPGELLLGTGRQPATRNQFTGVTIDRLSIVDPVAVDPLDLRRRQLAGGGRLRLAR